MKLQQKYDVVIAGGGLAGLTLALQLKQAQPGMSVLVLEKRSEDAPAATHKVGESLSELGASYLREILDLKDYLAAHHLPKFGFRFFLSPEQNNNISRRVEVGSKIKNPYPSHQVDRGLLENELARRLTSCGVEVILGAKVSDVTLSKSGHVVSFHQENVNYLVECRWIVDSTGRNGLLKKKLDLKKDMDHDINSSWFRLDVEIDPDHWCEDLEWRNFFDRGRRRLATNHLMGEGYWVWIIPLVGGKTSIGIVADPNYHPFERFNTFEKSLAWLEKYEPLIAKLVSTHKDKQLDFKVMKHFAFDTKQFYSTDRWALAGEAGAFMDPFYSPGTDFIALGNCWITDLIVRDINGENINLRTMIYELAHKELQSGWITLYRNMYGIFGKTQVMLMKITWDWASYWAIPNVLFINKGYTDINVLKQYSSQHNSIGGRFAKLNERMQELFRVWAKYDLGAYADHQQNVFDLDCLHTFHTELGRKYKPGELLPKIESNLKILEQIAAEIFRRVSNQVCGTPADMNIDPYEMRIDDGKEELLRKSMQPAALNISLPIKTDIDKMWLKNIKTLQDEFA